MRIVFPELENPIVLQAVQAVPGVEPVLARGLNEAGEMLKNGLADSIIAGLDYSSRDVVLAYKEHIPLQSKFFSSCFIGKKGDQILALADGGVNKIPNAELLYIITEDTAKTFEKFTGKTPRIAMLSYSTNGSGGKNPDLEKIHFVIDQISKNHPDWVIDGEMQLDVAVDRDVAKKKFPTSKILGDANVLIVPDLNSGNILYKALERFGGFVMAGPIIQGFVKPLADLSRGSSPEDVKLTIEVIKKLIEGEE